MIKVTLPNTTWLPHVLLKCYTTDIHLVSEMDAEFMKVKRF
jgi:hypothetical protein